MIVFGISTCSICKNAVKALEAAGKDVTFRDVRTEPLDEAELATLLAEFGDRLVDRTTNDWRGLTDWLKHSEADAQLTAKPKLMTRPVIQNGDAYFLGWDAGVQDALLA